jgi:hypothetical protein
LVEKVLGFPGDLFELVESFQLFAASETDDVG